QHFFAAVLCNSVEANPSLLIYQVADVFLANDFKFESMQTAPAGNSINPAATSSLTAVQMDAFSGLYWNRDADDFMKVSVNHVQRGVGNGAVLLMFKPFDQGHFHVSNLFWGDLVDFHFVLAASGQPRCLEQIFGGGKPDVFESVEPFAPTAADLDPFINAY